MYLAEAGWDGLRYPLAAVNFGLILGQTGELKVRCLSPVLKVAYTNVTDTRACLFTGFAFVGVNLDSRVAAFAAPTPEQ